VTMQLFDGGNGMLFSMVCKVVVGGGYTNNADCAA
jgi:hypothetical protein